MKVVGVIIGNFILNIETEPQTRPMVVCFNLGSKGTSNPFDLCFPRVHLFLKRVAPESHVFHSLKSFQ